MRFMFQLNVRDVPRAGERRMRPSELQTILSGGGPYDARPFSACWQKLGLGA